MHADPIRLLWANTESVLDGASISWSALFNTTTGRPEKRNPTLPTKGGSRRVPGCFAKMERELPSPHMLHYNIIVLAESPPPLLTAPATRFWEARTAAKDCPCMHFCEAW